MKTVKKSVIRLLVMVMIMVGGITVNLPVNAKAETTVYVTPTGSKYHTHKCGNGNFYQTTLSQAKARGLTPCSKCFGSGGGYEETVVYNETVVKEEDYISFDEDEICLVAGSCYRQKPDTNVSRNRIRWSTSNNKVAKVSSDGKVEAVGKGTAFIKAQAGSDCAKYKVKVEEVSLSWDEIEITPRDTHELAVKGCRHPYDIRWRSEDKSIAVVDDNGTVRGKDVGRTKITATVHGKKLVCKVKVGKPAISELYFDKETYETSPYEAFTVKIRTDNKMIFDYFEAEASSSKEGIELEVDGNEIMVIPDGNVNDGESVVTVKLAGHTAEFKVVVIPLPQPEI